MTAVRLHSEEGFTLMELIVSINLAFIALAIMVSIYLLTYKLVFSTTRKIDEKETLISIIQHIDQSVKQRHDFCVTTISNGTAILLFDQKDTVYISSQSIMMSNYLTSENLDTVMLQIKPKEEDLLTILGVDSNNEQKTVSRKNEYTHVDLEYIRLRLWQREKPYVFSFYISESSGRQFTNIELRK